MASAWLAVLGFARDWWKSKQKVREVEAEAKARRIEKGIPGWADEYLVIVWSYPFIAQFIPALADSASQGLAAAAALPDWYIGGFISISFSVFGINKIFQWKANKK